MIEMRNPKVSVIIALYNHARYLPFALDSILAQTYQDFEIVVVDDGSIDDGYSVAQSYAEKYPEKIQVLTHEGHVNRGISSTCNLAIQRSRGEYLAWIGADDAWCPQKLELQVAQMDGNPELGFVYSFANLMDGAGQKLKEQVTGTDLTQSGNQCLALLLAFWIPATTLMFRRQSLEQAGLFDEGLIYGDWELCVRILAHWKMGCLALPLAYYRIHGNNISVSQRFEVNLPRNRAVFTALHNKANRIGGDLGKPRHKALIAFKLAYYDFCSGDLEAGRSYLLSIFRLDPSLLNDTSELGKWIWFQQFDLVQPADGSKFSSWATSIFLPSLGATRVKRIRTAIILLQAHSFSRSADYRSAQRMIFRCLVLDFTCFKDRRNRAVLAEALIPLKLLKWFRLVKQKVLSLDHTMA